MKFLPFMKPKLCHKTPYFLLLVRLIKMSRGPTQYAPKRYTSNSNINDNHHYWYIHFVNFKIGELFLNNISFNRVSGSWCRLFSKSLSFCKNNNFNFFFKWTLLYGFHTYMYILVNFLRWSWSIFANVVKLHFYSFLK